MSFDARASSVPAGAMVLVVDDDPPIREMWRTILSQSAGVTVIDAADGAAAIRMARMHQPDVVIMDLAMPTLDGLAAARRLKQDDATAAIPVIAVTGVLFDTQGVLDAGCEGYMTKPVRPQHLVDKIAEVLRKHGLNRSRSGGSGA